MSKMQSSVEFDLKKIQEILKQKWKDGENEIMKQFNQYLSKYQADCEKYIENIQKQYIEEKETLNQNLIDKLMALKQLVDNEKNFTLEIIADSEQMLIQKQRSFDKSIELKEQEIGDLKQQLIQFKNHIDQLILNNKQLNEQQEKVFDDFKNLQEKINQKNIEQNEDTYQKILEQEVQKLNFSSEEVKIQAHDINELSKEAQDNLQQLQGQLKILEQRYNGIQFKQRSNYKIKEMKEENECIQDKLEKKNVHLKQKCRSYLDDLKKCQDELIKCQKLLIKCEEDSKIKRKESEIEKDTFEENQNIYKQELKKVKKVLKIKESELFNCKKALEESELKYQQLQMQNIKEKEDFQSQTQQLRQTYDSTINELKASNDCILKQQNEQIEQYQQAQYRRQNEEFEFQKQQLRETINQLTFLNKSFEQQYNEFKQQQEKIFLKRMIDFQAKLEYELTFNQVNNNNSTYKDFINFLNPMSYFEKKQQNSENYQQIIQDLSKLLIKLQEDRIKNLKELGVQVISELQANYSLNSLLDENFFMQVLKLIAIVNDIVTDKKTQTQGSEEIQHITKNLEQLHQLKKNLMITIRRKQNNEKQHKKVNVN